MNSCGVEADVDPLEADEHADAVVDVDDEVADLEVAEVGEERPRRRPAALVGLPLLLEDVGLGPELEPGLGQAEAAAQMADADEHGARVRVLGALDRRGEDLVVGEQLDRALGAARRVRDEDHRVAALAAAPDLRDPVRHAPGELERRLTARCGPAAGPRRRAPASRAPSPPRARRSPSSQSTSSVAGRGTRWPFARGLVVARLRSARAACRRARGPRRARTRARSDGRSPEVVERRVAERSERRPASPRQLLQRHDGRLVERRGRALRRGVVGADRLDRVADELEADRLGARPAG